MSNNLKVMVVAADPLSTRLDMLEEESETIKTSLIPHHPLLEVYPAHVISTQQLQEKVRENQPDILHFTGHGNPTGRVRLENKYGHIQRKSSQAIAKVLKKAEARPECIVLNNCFTDHRQQELLLACDNVIGMAAPEGFDFALNFASSLYKNFKDDRNYQSAYESAIIDLEKIDIRNIVDLKFFDSSKFREIVPADKSVMSSEEMLYRSSELSSFEGGEHGSAPRPMADVSRDRGPRKYPVWFGTNRRPVDPMHPENGFDIERDDKLHYGYCEVAIPKFHKIGSIGNPWWGRWPFWKTDRLKLISIVPLKMERFDQELRASLTSVLEDERVVLLFIHGYNVDFNEAAIRAAQLGADLGVQGAMAFYSWPSKGRVKGYAADAASVEASEDHIREYLEVLSNISGAEKIHIIAHSMGNRGLIRVFDTLFAKISQNTKIKFNQIFLAAPDVDQAVFKNLAKAYAKLSNRTTLYISSKDKALYGSSYLHDFPRAGYKPPVTIVNGIDTIEVTNIDPSFLGHGYVAAAREILHDMHVLMSNNLSPNKRLGMESIVDAETNSRYWRLRS